MKVIDAGKAKKYLIAVILTVSGLGHNFPLYAQGEIGTLISESVEDTESAVKAYGGPLLKAIGTDLNSAWVNNAEPMEWGSLSLRFVGVTSFAPNGDLTFKPSEYGLDEAQEGGLYTNEEELPTIFGKDNEAQIQARAVSPDGSEIQTMTTIPVKTLGVRGAPMLMPQLNIGFFGGSQIMIRGLPPMRIPSYKELQSFETSYFGIGFLYDIKQWIPEFRFSQFSWSVYFTYSTAELSLDGPFYTYTDLQANSGFDIQSSESLPDYGKQEMSFNTKGYSLGSVISKEFSAITLFGGLEYVSSSGNLNLIGKYPYANYERELEHIEDLLDISENTGRMGVNGGVRLEMSFLRLSLSGTLVNKGYSTAAFSLGFRLFE